MPGTLFIVATPIGNLEDLTFRALRTLGEVDLIAAEDTRRTSRLLAHYEIRKPVVSLREHNESSFSPRLVARMVAGESIALVTDAGTPGISDPGAGFVASARASGIRVVPIPGCSAVVTALSASGLPAESFVFAGFPPPVGAERKRWFEELKTERRTVVLMEAPHRIRRTLEECRLVWPDSPLMVARELTKINEELVEWPHAGVAVRPLIEKGEFTIVIGPSVRPPEAKVTDEELVTLFGVLTSGYPMERDAAIAVCASAFGLPVVVVRKRIKKALIAAKRGAGDLT